jgi:MSHA biogenesis protein MshI
MQLFKRKAKSNSRVGLAIQSDQLVLAHVDIRKGEPYLLHGRTAALESEKDAGKALEKLVKELELDGQQVSYVLSPDDYHLHLVEAPKVEPEELRAAVRWKVKDLLEMKIDDAAIDVFQVPKEAYRGRDMVYVVASQKSRIKYLIEMINNAGLEMAVIDIPELAMNNITRRFIDDSNGVAFMDLRRTGSTMNISLAGDMYLTRRINTQLDPEVMRSPEWPSLKDRLVLEIQRSLDYYESQMGRPQITRVVVAQRQHDTIELTGELNELLAAQVTPLDLSAHMQGDETLTPEYQQLGFTAIGATLRGLKKPGPKRDDNDGAEQSSQEAA